MQYEEWLTQKIKRNANWICRSAYARVAAERLACLR